MTQINPGRNFDEKFLKKDKISFLYFCYLTTAPVYYQLVIKNEYFYFKSNIFFDKNSFKIYK